MVIYNANGTGQYKPINKNLYSTWIQFYNFYKHSLGFIWDDLFNRPETCRVVSCNDTKLDGCHVVLSEEDSELVEQMLKSKQQQIRQSSQGAQEMRQIHMKSFNHKDAIIAVRMVPADWSRDYSPDEYHRPMFITAMCDSCNGKDDTLKLKSKTILIPLYVEDRL